MYSLCPFRKSDRNLALPPTLAIFRSLLFLSFSYVYVCLCIYCFRVLCFAPRSLADESSTARQCATSYVILPCVVLPRILFSGGYPVLRERVLSSPRAARYSAFLHAVDVDLKVGRFLVSLIPEKSMQTIRTIRDMWRNIFEMQEVI